MRWRILFWLSTNSPTLTVLTFAVRNIAVCANDLEPSAMPSVAGVPVALGKPKGILREAIKYIEHSCRANTADDTERN